MMTKKFDIYKFTLFEVLIAITVIAICFVVILNALSLNIQNTSISNGYITACFLANSKLAEILSQEKISEEDQETDSDGDFGDDYQGFTWKLKVQKILNQDKEEVSNLYKIDLRTFFEEGNRKRQVTIETVAYSPDKKKNDSSSSSTGDKN